MKRKNYRKFWENIIKFSHAEVFKFNIDIDDLPLTAVKRIARHMKSSLKPYIRSIKIWKNNNAKKHFHIEVNLKYPLPFYQVVFARILGFDDIKRLRLDLIRCGNNQFNLIDYISTKKYLIPPEQDVENFKKEVELLSEYELVKVMI